MFKQSEAQILSLKRFAKPSCEFFCPCNKINNNHWVFSTSHAILVMEDWILSDPDPANNFGSDRIRIHNTVFYSSCKIG